MAHCPNHEKRNTERLARGEGFACETTPQIFVARVSSISTASDPDPSPPDSTFAIYRPAAYFSISGDAVVPGDAGWHVSAAAMLRTAFLNMAHRALTFRGLDLSPLS